MTLWTAARQASLSITNSQSLLKLKSIKWVMPSNHLILTLFFSCLQSFPASGSFPMSQLFVWRGQSISFTFSISPSSEYSGLISFKTDWFDLLAVQGTLKSLFSNTTVLMHAFLIGSEPFIIYCKYFPCHFNFIWLLWEIEILYFRQKRAYFSLTVGQTCERLSSTKLISYSYYYGFIFTFNLHGILV